MRLEEIKHHGTRRSIERMNLDITPFESVDEIRRYIRKTYITQYNKQEEAILRHRKYMRERYRQAHPNGKRYIVD